MKVCSLHLGHMTKMPATPIYGKIPFKILFSGTKWPLALGHDMQHWRHGPNKVWKNDDLGLTMTFLYPPHNSGRVLWFHVGRLCVCLSVRPSVSFSFLDDNLSKHQMDFHQTLVCALMLWRSGLGLLMGKFRQIFTELSARDMPIFSFLDVNLSK